jgi:hypothetical protein
MTEFWQSVLIAFIVFQVFILAIIGTKLYFFIKQNPPSILPGKFGKVLTWKIIYLLFDVWSEIMFWIVFFISAYWFIAFKL